MMNIFKRETPAGKPKIVDYNNFSVATGADNSKESHELFERLVLSYKILSRYSINRLKTMGVLEPLVQDSTDFE